MDLTPCNTVQLKHRMLQHQLLILYCKHTANYHTILWISWNKICWLVITSRSTHLSAVCIVCPPMTNLTAPQPLPFLSVRQSTYLPVLPSFPGSADSSISPLFLSVCLSVQLSVLPWLCWQLLGSHAVAVFCSVMATGATPALSQPMDRQPFFLTLFAQIFLLLKSLFSPFPHLLPLSVSLFLSSVSISILLHHLDHLVAGKLAERQTGRGRQIGNIQSLEGFCSENLPAKPKASFPSSPCPPCCACT